MATFQLTVEQVSFQSEDLPIDSSSVDSFSSVVDPNVDFSKMAEETNACSSNVELSDLAEEWKSDMKGISMNDEVFSENHLSENKAASPATDSTVSGSTKGTVIEKQLLYSYDSIGSSYPNISLPVAHYLNKHNPDLCAEAEKYFNVKDLHKSAKETVALSSSVIEISATSSPFRSMSSTSEALALQHSVIGKTTVKPVSADVVAEVVANTKLRLREQNEKQEVHNISGKQCAVYSADNVDKCCSNELQASELIRYPSEYISSTTEKKSWFSSPSSDSHPVVPKTPAKSSNTLISTDSRRSSVSSTSSSASRKCSRSSNSEMPSVHVSVHKTQDKGDQSGASFDSFLALSHEKPLHGNYDFETESSFSEKYELESACSEAFETESNISEISGVDEEMSQIKKLLVDLPATPESCSTSDVKKRGSAFAKESRFSESQTCVRTLNANTSPIRIAKINQAVQTERFHMFELMCEKASLEGQLESVVNERDVLLKENNNLLTSNASLQAKLKSQENQSREAVAAKQKVMEELTSQNQEHRKWDLVIAEYQNIIEAKNSEIRALKDDVSESEVRNSQVRINLEELKVDMESKEGAVAGLKKKIAELHVEVQVLLQGKVQLQNEVKNVRSEMETLEKSKKWYQDQLHSTQEGRNKLHQELITAQADLVSVSNHLERTKSENNKLKQQLVESQQRAVKEKEVLMQHLETIEADMKEREYLFEEIQKDKGTAEEALIERARKIDEERSKFSNLNFTLSDLEHQLKITRADVSDKEKLVAELEKGKVEFMKQIAMLQKIANDKDLNNQQLLQDVKDLNVKMKHTEGTLASAKEMISSLKAEKTTVDVALASANEEKRVVNEALKVLKENLNRVEYNFKHMRKELVSKSSQVEQLLKEKSYLEEALQKAEQSVLYQQKEFEYQTVTENQNKLVLFEDLKKQKFDLENIITVYSKDLLNYQQTILCLEKEKEILKNELTKLRVSTKCAEDKVEILNSENCILRDKLLGVKKSVFQVEKSEEKNYFQSAGVQCSGDVSSKELDDVLNKVRKEYKEKQRVFESNIKVLSRKLRQKMKECKNAQNELKKLKDSKPDPSAPASELDEKSDGAICSKCEKFLEVQKLCENLEEQLSTVRSAFEEQKAVNQKNEEMIINLEKERGRITGISGSNQNLKLRVTELETCLAEKESIVSQLKHDIAEMKQRQTEDDTSKQTRLTALEEDLNKERVLIKGLRQQVFQEKRENSHLKRQLNSLKTGLEQANQTADSRKQDLASLQAELSVKVQAELKHRAEMEQLQTEICSRQIEIEKLTKEMDHLKERDPALAEQIKSLSWHLKEKSNEIAALKEKQKMLEESHCTEIEGLKRTIQSLQDEVETVKCQLRATRKEKFNYQAKVAELRTALKSKIAKSKEMCGGSPTGGGNKAHSNSPSLLELNIPDPQATFDESYINSLLQQSLIVPESRPLSNLQACLNSLKQEMAELQKQLSYQSETAS